MPRTSACLVLMVLVGSATAGALTASETTDRQGPQASRVEQPQEKKRGARTDIHGDPLPDGAIARIGTLRLRGDALVNVIAFSPDGRLLAYGSESGLVHVCEAASGKQLFHFQPGEVRHRPVTELAFSPDTRTLAVSGYWSTNIWLIDLATRKVKYAIPNTTKDHDRWARLWQGPAFAFTPDGRNLVVGGKDGSVHVWETATGSEQAALPVVKERLVSLMLSGDGRTALTAHYGGALHLWDIAGRKHLQKLAASAKHPHFTALAPDGKTVAVALSETE